MLVRALHYYEISLCPCGCGYPARVTHDDRYEGWFSVDTVTCLARTELAKHDKEHKEPPPGELRWVALDLPWGKAP